VASQGGPTYNLATFQAEVRAQRYRVTRIAFDGAAALGLDGSDIEDCVLQLSDRDFYKTMPAESGRGQMQDVYRPTYNGIAIYLKLQHDTQAFIIQFKER
jgi:hypothetical protein